MMATNHVYLVIGFKYKPLEDNMIDYQKLEGRNIFTQSKLELIKRWYIKREHKILAIGLSVLVIKTLGENIYLSLRPYFQ